MPSISGFNIAGLSISGILQPKLSYRFNVRFFFQQSVLSNIDNPDYLSNQCISFTRPKLTFDKVTVPRFSVQAYVPGRPHWGTCSLTVEDDISGKATNIIQQQINAQNQITLATGGNSSFPNAAGADYYKFLTVLSQLDGQHNATPIEQWQIEGCWIEDVDYGKNDYAQGGESMHITMTISIDNAIQLIQGNTQDSSAISGFATGQIVA